VALVLNEHMPLLDEWLAFLKGKAIKAVSRDLWAQTLEFAYEVKAGRSRTPFRVL
jgi:hypothetical protein